jgi:hypothetical protein
MVILFHQVPRPGRAALLASPVLAFAGLALCGLPLSVRVLLAALCLWTTVRNWPGGSVDRRVASSGWLAVSASAVLSCRLGSAPALLPLAAVGRAAAWGLAVRRARWNLGGARDGGLACLSTALSADNAAPAGLRALARFLIHRHPARTLRHRHRIRYTRALRPHSTAPCPPS